MEAEKWRTDVGGEADYREVRVAGAKGEADATLLVWKMQI